MPIHLPERSIWIGAGLIELGQELGVGEVRADRQQRVAAHHHLVGRDRAQQPDRAGHPRQLVGQHVLTQQRLRRAGAEQVGDLGQLLDAAAGALPDQQRDLLARR